MFAEKKCAAVCFKEKENDGSQRCNHGWLRKLAEMAAVAVLVPLTLGVNRETQAQTFTVIHAFTGPDGVNPQGRLFRDAQGNLYGTTSFGGSSYLERLGAPTPGLGEVFKIDPSGNESVFYSFGDDSFSYAGGAYPVGGLISDPSANLYGTTSRGGLGRCVSGCGTVFKLDRSGNETVLHFFGQESDGANPTDLVSDRSGNIYGTTVWGGRENWGTVFKLDPSGNETVLYSFTGGADGANPEAGLIIDASDNLYGTASHGGSVGDGTVFKLDPSGNLSVIHDFIGGADGALPAADLIMDASGNLYGTTFYGGPANAGTVFKVDRSGNEAVLHSFTGTDGANPHGGLVRDQIGNLFGTTSGSSNTQCFSGGCGTVFKIDPSGNFSVLHSFTGIEGAQPIGGLIWDAPGKLYGTTVYGGSANYGTVFEIALFVPFSSFEVKLDGTAGPQTALDLKANFTQGSGAETIDPVVQGLTLIIGSYTLTIPPGSFHQTKKGWFVYKGVIGGAAVQARLSQTGARSYELQTDASGVDLISLPDPVTVTLTLGNNSGTTQTAL